ncbi:MAG: WecB/TagA/CpsF family glycosyltransferase [Candidatus Spechtbacteria bacterium]|nr:WecB/TagA/CpsF family glycosyltransferase [Candidatus Spechtbacteria bacterium]
MKTLDILGTKVHAVSFKKALHAAEEFLYDGKQHYIVTPNPEIVLEARKSKSYQAILNRADLSLPDGAGIVWASRILHGGARALQERIAGVDFMTRFLSYRFFGSSKTYLPHKILLLGGGPGIARKAAAVFQRKFPHLTFYAIENIKNKHLFFLVNHILQPDCIFVALGAPAQERWIARNLRKFQNVRLAMGVGGAFDMISRRIPRAPSYMRVFGLEWLWRFIMEPRRAVRIFRAAVIFPFFVFVKKFRS